MFNIFVLIDKLERKIAKIDDEIDGIKSQREKTLQDINVVKEYKAKQKEERKRSKRIK